MKFRFLLALVACSLVVGCNNAGKGRANEKEVEVALFQGGYGLDFFEQSAREYESKHPGVKIRVWGNPRVWEQLQPRFIADTPPDLTWPGWDMKYWSLVYENQVLPLDRYLDEKPYEGTGTWRATFEPKLLEMCKFQGKTWMLPYHYSILGWWYNVDLFKQHEWTPPRTWAELLALGAKMKSAGIAPITYQGQYPSYVMVGMLIPWVVSAGGVKAWDDAENLVPGAWKSPAFLKAAQMILDLRSKGYFQTGANGMTHTEAQSEFLKGTAAMVPCGTWLHSEMEKQLPEGFRMDYMLPPVLDNGPGDPTALCIYIEPWVLPTAGKNRDVAIDYYKYITSLPKAKQFIERKGTPMSIKGSDAAKLPDYLKSASTAFARCKTVWDTEYTHWYPSLNKECENAMQALLEGKATPQQFCDRLEAAADAVRRNTKLPKHRVTRE